MPSDEFPGIIIQGYCINPEMRYTPSGTAMLKFSIPVDSWTSKEKEGYKPAYNGKGYVATTWQRFVVFGEKAEKANEWLTHRLFVRVSVQANGDAENNTMTPKIYQGKASYDWMVKEFLTDEPENPEYVPEVEDENQIPF